MPQWEYCYIYTEFETDVTGLMVITPDGYEEIEGEYEDKRDIIVALLRDGWEPLGEDEFKRPHPV
jgi:hypothetical protein